MKTTLHKHKPYQDHDEVAVTMLRDDPEFAAAYINAVLEDGDQEELMRAMRRIPDAFGGVKRVAELTKLHPKTLYRTLSPPGNPALTPFTSLLGKMGLRIAVAPVKTVSRRKKPLLKKAG